MLHNKKSYKPSRIIKNNKQTDIVEMSGKLNHMLMKIENLNSQLKRIKSQNTKARDGPEITNIIKAIGLAQEMT